MSFFASLLAEVKSGIQPLPPSRLVAKPTTTTTKHPDYGDETPVKKISLDDLFDAEIARELILGGCNEEAEEEFGGSLPSARSGSAGGAEAETDAEAISLLADAGSVGEKALEFENGESESVGDGAGAGVLSSRAGLKRGCAEVEEVEGGRGKKKVRIEEAEEEGKEEGNKEENEELWDELFGGDPGEEVEGIEVVERGWDSEGWETAAEAGWDSEGWETVDEE